MIVKIKRLIINFKFKNFIRSWKDWKTLSVINFIVFSLIYLGIRLRQNGFQHFYKWDPGKIVQREVNADDTFQIVLDHCKIPLSHITSEAYKRSNIKRLPPDLDKCDGFPEFSKLKNNIVTITGDKKFEDCCLKEILRPFALPSDDFKLGNECKKIDKVTRSIDVSEIEHMLVQCNVREGQRKKPVFNFHANFPLTGVIKRKCEYWNAMQSYKDVPPSVLVLIIGSTSRTHIFRSLPKTMKMMTQKMNFIDFKGHHPVGEPTLINMLAILTGMQSKEYWGAYKLSQKDYWDPTAFIWDVYSRLNYITGYFEDVPFLGTFSWGGQRGFVKRPADLLTRPIMASHNKLLNPFTASKKSVCFGRRKVLQFVLDYILTILQRQQNVPKFLVAPLFWPTTQVEASLSVQDDTFFKFFTTISQDENLLENTVIILTSDNGFTQGTYAQTHEGLIERRNMPLFIRIPNKIRRQNPSFTMNALENAEGITSHFDVFQTMLHIAKMSNGGEDVDEISKNGHSLLKNISINTRSCENAMIPLTMCSCNLPVPDDDSASMLGNKTKMFPLQINKSEIIMRFTK